MFRICVPPNHCIISMIAANERPISSETLTLHDYIMNAQSAAAKAFDLGHALIGSYAIMFLFQSFVQGFTNKTCGSPLVIYL